MAATGWELPVFAGMALMVCCGCLLPNRWLPPLPNDKLMHFAAFAILALLAIRIGGTPAAAALWLALLFSAGLVIEVLQSLVPERGFCWRDVAANTAGIVFAAGSAYIAGIWTSPH